tara:strand:- start:515 stop:928 length:414 start_codon:yes stop_codon:yes gene_type:complete
MTDNAKQVGIRIVERFGSKATKKINRALFLACNEVRNEAVKSIVSGNKSGITYQKYQPRREHIASSAGEAPASDTGFLVSQITQEVSNKVGKVISSAPYSAALEFGTTTMAARPFLQPALRKSQNKIRKIFMREGLL